MLNELCVHAKLIEDVGMRTNMLGVCRLLLLKPVLLGLIRIVVHSCVWDMGHIQKNTTPGQPIAVHRYRRRVQLRKVVKESSAAPLVPDALHGRVPLVTVREHIHDHIGRVSAIPRWEQGWRKVPIRYMDGRWRRARPCCLCLVASIRGYNPLLRKPRRIPEA